MEKNEELINKRDKISVQKKLEAKTRNDEYNLNQMLKKLIKLK